MIYGARRFPFKSFLQKAFQILKIDDNYRTFLAVQILRGAGALSLPFYVLYARDILHIELSMVGIFLMAQMIGSIVSNILWAYLSDFAGNKKVIQISTLLGIAPPLIALIIPHQFPEIFVLLFIVIGFFVAGSVIGKTNFLLDIAPPKERPVYISLNGTLSIPIMLFPLLGGIIVQHMSYKFLFIITSLLILVGLVLSFKLKEPRNDSNAGTTVQSR
ncbi:hypothetical protein ES703_95453 [subsurface metagenome]